MFLGELLMCLVTFEMSDEFSWKVSIQDYFEVQKHVRFSYYFKPIQGTFKPNDMRTIFAHISFDRMQLPKIVKVIWRRIISLHSQRANASLKLRNLVSQ